MIYIVPAVRQRIMSQKFSTEDSVAYYYYYKQVTRPRFRSASKDATVTLQHVSEIATSSHNTQTEFAFEPKKVRAPLTMKG